MGPTSKFILIALILSSGCSYRVFGQSVKEYDEPEIQCYLQDTILNVSINTELPENTIVSISVSRSYWKKESESEYSIDYFSKRGNVAEWQVTHEILIDETKWRSELHDHLKILTRSGLASSVGKISDSIRISVIVPHTNKPYPKFKETGRNERALFAPLRYSAARFQEFANPESLAVGRSYMISRVTPLMPELQPADPLRDFARKSDLPIESIITILSVSKKGGRSWYQVTAKDKMGKLIGTGWVNSVALIGQEISLTK